MTAEMLPGLGDYLGIVDLSPVLFPSFKQQVRSMEMDALQAKIDKEHKKREAGWQQRMKDYEAAKKWAEKAGYKIDPGKWRAGRGRTESGVVGIRESKNKKSIHKMNIIIG